MTRKVLMLAPSHFAGEPLSPGDTPTLPDDVADRLIERGRAVEADAETLAASAPSPRGRGGRNRGASAVIDAPAADPAAADPAAADPAASPVGDGLPEIVPDDESAAE